MKHFRIAINFLYKALAKIPDLQRFLTQAPRPDRMYFPHLMMQGNQMQLKSV